MYTAIIENKLSLYSRSKDFLWTDEYIAKNMLQAHLDTNHDAASRNGEIIAQTVQWIHREIGAGSSLIDLGCGPGLYAEQLSSLGHSVVGLDISSHSIQYARQSSGQKNLHITYINGSYLNPIELGQFDVAICIYCDFGALTPDEQKLFFNNVHALLKDDGILIFDVFSEGLSKTKKEERDFQLVSHEDFWSKNPHVILSETAYFEKEKVWGQRNIIIDQQTSEIKEFTTWDTLYTEERITKLVEENGFIVEKIEKDLVRKNGFTSNDVLFVKARKK
ncbi:MAG: class I SAM-dependent methyltransferase [Vallitaleaceae bacterium]|nr:class I SAM-dependent methyltransferase [Vallitaleaceae bacterium]